MNFRTFGSFTLHGTGTGWVHIENNGTCPCPSPCVMWTVNRIIKKPIISRFLSLSRSRAVWMSHLQTNSTARQIMHEIPVLWLIHTARDRDRDRDREMMVFCVMLYTVHTTPGQGQGQVTIVFYCTHPGPVPVPFPVPCSVNEPLDQFVGREKAKSNYKTLQEAPICSF